MVEENTAECVVEPEEAYYGGDADEGADDDDDDDDEDDDDDDDVDTDDDADFFRHTTILICSLHPHRLLQSLHEGYVAGPLDRSENLPLTVIGLEWFGLDRIGWRTINSFLFLLSRCMPPARSQKSPQRLEIGCDRGPFHSVTSTVDRYQHTVNTYLVELPATLLYKLSCVFLTPDTPCSHKTSDTLDYKSS